jgi:hypothetical protein
MQIDSSDEQPINAELSMQINLEFGSKVRLARQWQELKHLQPIISTDAGMQIECSDRQLENARHSIRTSFDGVSNLKMESAPQ